MATPDPTSLLGIPGWWLWWFVLTAFGSVGLAFIVALFKSKPTAPQPLPPDPYNGFTQQYGATLTVAPPVATQGLLHHPFVQWVLWLYGAWAALMGISFILFLIINGARLFA